MTYRSFDTSGQPPMTALARCALLSLPLLVLGCGGSGAPGPITITLFATPNLSGYSLAQGDFLADDGLVIVGDVISQHGFGEEGMRGYLSFDLQQIPPGVSVLSATLRVDQEVVANGPYPSLGALVVDQTVYGNVLDVGAYSRSFPSNQGFGTLSSDATLGTKSVNATAAVALDVASARTQSQFRLRFTNETNADGGETYVILSSVGPAFPNQPTLVVTYQP
jgi:hypothetical protein